jgi:hypothetical protein
VKKIHEEGKNQLHSIDLTAATDRLPLLIQKATLDLLFIEIKDAVYRTSLIGGS